jgi:glycosyltransferase involved in cell wall biosynthesis
MTTAPPESGPADLPVFDGHILHIVARETAARWAPLLRQVLQTQHDSGARVTLLTDDQELLASVEHAGYERLPMPFVGGWRAWRLMFALPRMFPNPPEIIHQWGTGGLRWVQRWTRPRQLPLIIHTLGAHDLGRLRRRPQHGREQVIVPSSGLCQAVLGWDPAQSAGWHVLPPAAGLPFDATDAPGLGDRTLSILCASRLGPHHGLEVLIEAIAQLIQKGHDVQAVIVGDGPGASWVWQHIRTHKANEHCVVLDEPRLWEKGLPGADVCVVPASERGLWLTPLLAMGLGRVVIAARNQVAEWFIEDATTWQFTPGSAVELAYLLTRATEQPKAVRDLSAQAADYFYSHHAVGNFLSRLADVYQSAVGAPVDHAKAEASG